MPAIQSYRARDIRTGDTVTIHTDITHRGEVTAAQHPTHYDVNIAIDCVTCGSAEHPAIELYKRSPGALITAERNPRRARDTRSQTDASRKARANA